MTDKQILYQAQRAYRAEYRRSKRLWRGGRPDDRDGRAANWGRAAWDEVIRRWVPKYWEDATSDKWQNAMWDFEEILKE